MKLIQLEVERFKKIRRAVLDLADLNILVGANGSGKSSVLQAVHLSACLMRQADVVRPDRTSPVGINDLDYLPTDSYRKLGHNATWGNQQGTPSSEVRFHFVDENDNPISADLEFRSARNAGISVTGNIPYLVSPMFRRSGKFFSSYIPGISGIPNEEQKQSKRVVQKACSFGDANVYLRNVLNLLSDDQIGQVQDWLSELIGPVLIDVSHEEDADLVISASVCIRYRELPLELLGMGYLQLIQIFSYVLLFRPHILLIDEPDIHLHPNVQELLSATLARVAAELDLKILLTTHSPFIVRGAPLDANVYWMDDGEVQNSTRQSTELSLGWGAFGKRIIVVSEDADTVLLQKLVGQWPEIANYVAFLPGRGYRNLMNPDQAFELYNTLGKQYKIVVHRDRDALSNDEVAKLCQDFDADGVSMWVTEHSDVEAYYCLPDFLNQLTGLSTPEAERILGDVLKKWQKPISEKFTSQRKSHNKELHAAGGGPTNQEVWDSFQNTPLRGANGKFVYNQLKNAIPNKAFTDHTVRGHTLDGEMATSLRDHLRKLIED